MPHDADLEVRAPDERPEVAPKSYGAFSTAWQAAGSFGR